MRLIIARHCETEWNARRKVQGSTDVPLNARGREQAAMLGERLAGARVRRIVCSPLVRAWETAAIAGLRLGVATDVDARLRECSFGMVEGMPFGLFELLFGKTRGRPKRTKLRYDFRLFGGERAGDVLERQLSLVRELMALPDDGSAVLLVGHGRAIRTLLAGLGLDADDPPQGESIELAL